MRKKLAIFLVVLCTGFAGAVSGAAEKNVYTHFPKKVEFKEVLNLQGSVEAVNIARVSPRIPGPIESVFVKEGDFVRAGYSKLFVIDPMKLEKNVEINKQNLAIAGLSLKEKEARMKQAAADFEKSKVDAERFRLLWEDKSTSQDNYEKAQLKLRVSEATVEHIQTLIDLDREQHKKAALALAIAQKDFEDSTVLAPIDGVVSAKLQEPGEMAAPGKPILIIKNPHHTEVSAYVPAEYYHRIFRGKTLVEICTGANNCLESRISYKSPEILPNLRTFQVKCESTEGDASMVPGALAKLGIVVETREGLGVESGAILNRRGTKVVFVVQNGKAVMVPVETGLESGGLTEILSGDLDEGMQIIVRGQHLVNDGDPVNVVQSKDSEK